MRKILTIIALAATSCSLHSPVEPDSPVPLKTTDITVKVSCPGTRVTEISGEDEAAVNSLQVFVFDSDGAIDAVGRGSGGSLSINVTAGKGKRLWAVANAPDLTGVGTEDELCGSITTLTDNSVGNLVMAGNTTADILSDTEVPISLVRLAAKVTVKQITRRFSVAGLAARPLTIKRIYLINVAAGLRLDGTGEATQWLNRRGFASSGADALLSSDSGLDVSLSNGGTYGTAHSFYCYPNPCSTDSAGESWSPRKTRLVVEAELGGKLCWYSLTFPEILRNRTYTVENLTLSGKGSATPDTPYGREELSASVTVRDWTDGSSYTERL
jgi:hypothetical protein